MDFNTNIIVKLLDQKFRMHMTIILHLYIYSAKYYIISQIFTLIMQWH